MLLLYRLRTPFRKKSSCSEAIAGLCPEGSLEDCPPPLASRAGNQAELGWGTRRAPRSCERFWLEERNALDRRATRVSRKSEIFCLLAARAVRDRTPYSSFPTPYSLLPIPRSPFPWKKTTSRTRYPSQNERAYCDYSQYYCENPLVLRTLTQNLVGKAISHAWLRYQCRFFPRAVL